MTDRIPWGELRTLTDDDWTAYLYADGIDVVLTRDEAGLVFAAVEYERVATLAEVKRAQEIASRGHGGSLRRLWFALMDGARGLRFDEAAGDMWLSEIFERLGCRVEWRLPGMPDPNLARAREALGALKESRSA